ncbi:MAG: lamin tail domain-containing protein, partial [Bacteroidota bacterium]
VFSVSGQLTITEISYNPPESGTDSLEYIELYNETEEEIDLTNYVISDNGDHTIAGGTIAANGYAILAINPGAIMTVLGVEAIEIADIALSNGGESISISNPNGLLLDEVAFDDNPPWPTFEDGTDGSGATIELCDLESDNSDGSNWRAATNDLGVMVDGKAFLGTPAAENTVNCEIIVEVSSNIFTPADITINVGETVTWVNTGGFHNVNGTTDTYPDNPESFGNGAASGDLWTYEFTFTIPGVYDYQCDPHVGFGMVGTVTVEEEQEPEIPLYDIGLVNTINEDGFPDSSGVLCRVEGIVHGANLNPAGLQFALIDETEDAMGVFNGTNLGYVHTEGDKIRVTGRVSHFNGLLQMVEISALEVISAGNNLIGPEIVTELNESTESRLISIQGLVMADPSDWEGDGGDFNVRFVNSGNDTLTVRIDRDTELSTWEEGPDPTAAWNITGIGGQFDQNAPLFDGYQMFPRYITDFDLFTSTKDELEAKINLYPNPATNVINIMSDTQLEGYTLYNRMGKIMSKGVFKAMLDVRELPSGIYIIVLTKGEKQKVVRFVK